MKTKIKSLILQIKVLEKEKVEEIINKDIIKISDIDSSINYLKKELLHLLNIVEEGFIHYCLSFSINSISKNDELLKKVHAFFKDGTDDEYSEGIYKNNNGIESILVKDGIYVIVD
jgi:hypothetical protein